MRNLIRFREKWHVPRDLLPLFVLVILDETAGRVSGLLPAPVVVTVSIVAHSTIVAQVITTTGKISTIVAVAVRFAETPVGAIAAKIRVSFAHAKADGFFNDIVIDIMIFTLGIGIAV